MSKELSRYERTLVAHVAGSLPGWTPEVHYGRLIVTHNDTNSRAMVSISGDGRRNATADEAAEYVARLRRFLAGEIHKYTPEWADKGRAALATMPTNPLDERN